MTSLVVLVCVLCSHAALHAQEIGQLLGLQFRNRVLATDNTKPAILLTPQRAIRSITFDCERSDGKRLKLSAANLGPGRTRALVIRQKAGHYTYKAVVAVKFTGGTTERFAVDFDVLVAGPLKIAISEQDVDLTHNRLQFRLNRPAAKAQIKVWGESGSLIAENEASYDTATPPGSWMISWGPAGERATRILLKATDTHGFYTHMEVSLWSIEIPHEEVNFKFGSARIEASERPKLDDSLVEIRKILAKYAKQSLQAKLYIAGYTDTVGSRQSNLRLSEDRARSIAQYFRQKGLKPAIFYQGFGEDVLAVKTADEVPNEKNRRAIYILSNYPPPKSGAIPRNRWRKL